MPLDESILDIPGMHLKEGFLGVWGRPTSTGSVFFIPPRGISADVFNAFRNLHHFGQDPSCDTSTMQLDLPTRLKFDPPPLQPPDCRELAHLEFHAYSQDSIHAAVYHRHPDDSGYGNVQRILQEEWMKQIVAARGAVFQGRSRRLDHVTNTLQAANYSNNPRIVGVASWGVYDGSSVESVTIPPSPTGMARFDPNIRGFNLPLMRRFQYEREERRSGVVERNKCAVLECIAVEAKYRGMSIAKSLIRKMLDDPSFREHFLWIETKTGSAGDKLITAHFPEFERIDDGTTCFDINESWSVRISIYVRSPPGYVHGAQTDGAGGDGRRSRSPSLYGSFNSSMRSIFSILPTVPEHPDEAAADDGEGGGWIHMSRRDRIRRSFRRIFKREPKKLHTHYF